MKIFERVILESLLLFIGIFYPVSQPGRQKILYTHSKFSPFGPAQFCANPAVIHVEDLTQVNSWSTWSAIVAVTWMPLLPMPITATRFPLRSRLGS